MFILLETDNFLEKLKPLKAHFENVNGEGEQCSFFWELMCGLC